MAENVEKEILYLFLLYYIDVNYMQVSRTCPGVHVRGCREVLAIFQINVARRL